MPFSVGTVVLGQNFHTSAHRNGMEGVVVRGLHFAQGRNNLTCQLEPPDFRYLIEWADGNKSRVRHECLRKKQPPSGEQSVLDMFKLPAPAPRETEKE